MEQKGMDRRGFIVGSAVAAAGLSIGLPSFAFGADPLPGFPWPYAPMDPVTVGGDTPLITSG